MGRDVFSLNTIIKKWHWGYTLGIFHFVHPKTKKLIFCIEVGILMHHQPPVGPLPLRKVQAAKELL